MNRLIESINTLHKYVIENSFRIELITDYNFPSKDVRQVNGKELTLLNSLVYMFLIDSISFLDEYQSFRKNTEKDFWERIIIVKMINKPFIKKVLEWKNIRDLRNHMLAHNMRKGANGPYIFSISGLSYNAPVDFNDFYLLHNMLQLCYQTISFEFKNELMSFDHKSNLLIKPNISTKERLTKDKVSKITLDLLNQVDMIKKENNRNFEYNVGKPKYYDKM